MRVAPLLLLLLGIAACPAPDAGLACSVFGGGAIGGGVFGNSGTFAKASGSATQILFDRTFDLNASTLSTAKLPDCLGTGDTTCMVCAPTGTTMNCTWGDGQAETVVQGTSPTAYTSPMGLNALDTVTIAKSPSITSPSARLIAAFNGPHTVQTIVHAQSGVIGAGGVEPHWKWVSVGGSSEQVRGENDQNTDSAKSASNVIGGGPIMGWGFMSTSLTAQSAGTDTARADENNSQGVGATLTSSTGGALYFMNDNIGDAAQGSLAALILYSTARTNTQVDNAKLDAFAMRADASSPMAIQRNTRGWSPPWLTGNRAEPYAAGVPIVTTRGLEVHPGGDGTRPLGNGWIADSNSTGLPRKGLDASSWAEATATASTVNVDVASGYFAAWKLNNTAGNEMDEIVDASANDVGKKGSLNCMDTPAAGLVTVGIVARTGTTGTTLNKMRLGVVTDGTVGAPCTTWKRVRDNAAVTTLTSTPEYYECSFSVTGSPTSVVGEVLVGAANTDTGSIIVEAPTCSSATSAGPEQPLPDNLAYNADVPYVPASEVATWCTGEDAECNIEVVFTLDVDLPGTPTNAGNYIISSSDGTSAEIKLMMFETGNSNGHAATDVYVRDGWRSTPGGPRALVCPAGAFDNGGTDITSPGTLGTVAAQTKIVERMRVVPAGITASQPRVDHFIYADWPVTTATHATTLRASNTSHTMCAGDHGDTFAALGGRTSGSTPSGTNNNMTGSISRVTVVKGPWPF